MTSSHHIFSKINNSATAEAIKASSLELLGLNSVGNEQSIHNSFLSNTVELSQKTFSHTLDGNQFFQVQKNYNSTIVLRVLMNLYWSDFDKSLILFNKIKFSELTTKSDILFYLFLSSQFQSHETTEALILQTYKKTPSMRDLFSDVGWKIFIENNDCYDKAVLWIEKDIRINKFTEKSVTNYVIALSACGYLEKAEEEVKYWYKKSKNLNNLYTYVAWFYYVKYKNNLKKGYIYSKQDIPLQAMDKTGYTIQNRMKLSPLNWYLPCYNTIDYLWHSYYFFKQEIDCDELTKRISNILKDNSEINIFCYYNAIINGYIGNYDLCLEIVDKYRKTANTKNIYSNIAIALSHFKKKRELIINLFSKDYNSNNMSSGMKLFFGEFIMSSHNTKAKKIINEANSESNITRINANCYSNLG